MPKPHSKVGQSEAERSPTWSLMENKCFKNASQSNTHMADTQLTSPLRQVEYVYTGILMR